MKNDKLNIYIVNYKKLLSEDETISGIVFLDYRFILILLNDEDPDIYHMKNICHFDDIEWFKISEYEYYNFYSHMYNITTLVKYNNHYKILITK